MANRQLYIIDGHSQVFKAYHAIQGMSTSTGVPTNAVFGFHSILSRIQRQHQPDGLVVVFDSPGPTFRHELYTEYKANREAPPEDLHQQVEIIINMLTAMRIPILSMVGYEADDIIATLVHKAAQDEFDVSIISADKDLFQLVGDHVRMIRLENDQETIFDRQGVKDKMGVWPEQVGDYLALVGDSSDNVPGVRGIGPKTAAALLEKYSTLDGVLAAAAELKGKQRENIETGRDNALLSRKLVDLDRNVPVELNWASYALQEPDAPTLYALYRDLEFRRAADELRPLVEKARVTQYSAITTVAELEAFVAKIVAAGCVAIDTETTSTDALSADLVGISLCCEAGKAVYIPIGHTDILGGPLGGQLPLQDVQRVLAPVLANPSIEHYGHHIKFDWHVLRRHGLNLAAASFDTMIASYVLFADRRNHGLKDLAADLLGVPMTGIDQLIGSGRNAISFAEVDPDKATPYACADADMTFQLTQLLKARLKDAGEKVSAVLSTVELPLIPVLMAMETEGIAIEPTRFSQLSHQTDEKLADLRHRIFAQVGQEFNLGSPKQVANILFEVLGLKSVKNTKTGQSTDNEVLELLAEEHDVPRLLVEYRMYEKLKSTYIDVLPTLMRPGTHRVHTTFNQHVAATGRLSSSDPNLQNIPIRSEWGRHIREGFVPRHSHWKLLSADYSQIELRVLAHVSNDAQLVHAFQNGLDVHRITAASIFGMAEELVTDEMRDQAKTVNFGIIYGMSAAGLSQRLRISMADAKRFIAEYFHLYSGVKLWLDTTLERARELGYVETVSGRRRLLPDIRSRNFNQRSSAERMAVNTPIQGTSADMIKLAMLRVRDALQAGGFDARMVLQVHDELIFDAPEAEMERLIPTVTEAMVNALPLNVPVLVSTGVASNWAEC